MVEGATLRSAMMASIDATRDDRQFSCDAWTWWQARRLRYNVTLAVGGCTAYAVAIADNYTFGHPAHRALSQERLRHGPVGLARRSIDLPSCAVRAAD